MSATKSLITLLSTAALAASDAPVAKVQSALRDVLADVVGNAVMALITKGATEQEAITTVRNELLAATLLVQPEVGPEALNAEVSLNCDHPDIIGGVLIKADVTIAITHDAVERNSAARTVDVSAN